MRHSLHSHLLHLENAVQFLRDRLTGTLTAEERERLLVQLSTAELSLAHYREAYALELSVSGPEPSGNTGSGSSSNSGTEGRSGPRGKNDTGGARHVRMRPRARFHRLRVRSRLPGASLHHPNAHL